MTPQRSRFTIDFDIPAYWTPEQAIAVFDLLTDLREKIWNHYQMQILDLAPEYHGANSSDPIEIDPSEIPF